MRASSVRSNTGKRCRASWSGMRTYVISNRQTWPTARTLREKYQHVGENSKPLFIQNVLLKRTETFRRTYIMTSSSMRSSWRVKDCISLSGSHHGAEADTEISKRCTWAWKASKCGKCGVKQSKMHINEKRTRGEQEQEQYAGAWNPACGCVFAYASYIYCYGLLTRFVPFIRCPQTY